MNVKEPPDKTVHKLLVNEGNSIRIYFESDEITIPVTPCYENQDPNCKTVECEYIEGIIKESPEVTEGGMVFIGHNSIHIKQSDWISVGLHRQWMSSDIDVSCPFTHINYRLSVYASRRESDMNTSFSHLNEVPESSPLMDWKCGNQSKPPKPIKHLYLYENAVRAEGEINSNPVTKIGEVSKVEILNKSKYNVSDPEIPIKQDSKKNNDKTTMRSDTAHLSNTSYSDLEEIPQTEEILNSLCVINRKAKVLASKAGKTCTPETAARKKVYELKMNALYDLKRIVMAGLIKSDAESVHMEKHRMESGLLCWCAYFETNENTYAFHQPENLTDQKVLNDAIVNPEKVETKDVCMSSPYDTDIDHKLSLNDAISTINSTTNICCSDILTKRAIEDYRIGSDITLEF